MHRLRMFVCMIATLSVFTAFVVITRHNNYVAAYPSPSIDPRLKAAFEPAPQGKLPKVAVDSMRHDFGIVQPNSTYEYKFPIQNLGDAPLQLSSAGTTSPLLSLRIDPHTLLPGRTGHVIVNWDAQSPQNGFAQFATISTNDPSRPAIEFELRGNPRVLLMAEPPVLAARTLQPGEECHLETIVVSPAWQNFTLDVHPSRPDIRFSLTPLDPGELNKYKMKSGWRITVELPSDLPSGNLNEKLQLTAVPMVGDAKNDNSYDPAAQPLVRELPIYGSVSSRLAVYGEGLTTLGTIQAGTINSRTGYDGVFTVRVNDSDPKLQIEKVVANPSEIEAQLEPYPDAGGPGIYRLHVHIPPSDIAAAYVGQSRGKLTIAFDHPRIKKLELGVSFVVMNAVR